MLIDYYYVIYVINESEHVSFKREKIFKFLFNGTVLHTDQRRFKKNCHTALQESSEL